MGYPESLTDPSYKGQLLTLTYPLIGNYGVPSVNTYDEFGLPAFFESDKVQVHPPPHLAALPLPCRYPATRRTLSRLLRFRLWLHQPSPFQVSALIVSECCESPSHHACKQTLHEYLMAYNVQSLLD